MRTLRFACCIFLFAALAQAAAAAERVEYFAVFADGAKIGYSQSVRKEASGKVTTATTMEITVARDVLPITIRQGETSLETADGRPLGFKNVQELGLMAQTVEGTIEPSGRCRVRTTSAGQTQETLIDWPKAALLTEGVRLMQLGKGLKEGTVYSAVVFDTSSLAAENAEVRIGPKKDIDLLGRVVRLTEVKTVLNTPAGPVAMTSYVDDQCLDQKTLMAAAGINLEIVACSREVALSPNDPVDFFDKVIVPSPQKLEGLSSARSVTYHLASTSGEKLNVPAIDNQTVTPGADGTVMVTVSPSKDPSGASFPYAGPDQAARAAMKPTRYLESDRPEIVSLGRKAVGDTRDAAEASRRIEKFVRQYITTKDLSVGYASAAEVAASRQGDCSEHAVLAAAMCRAAGIPAQVVAGVAYVPEFAGREGVFGPHVWVRAHVGGKWIGLDAALPGGWDPGHIALAVGDGSPSDFFGIISTLGNFKIARIDVQK